MTQTIEVPNDHQTGVLNMSAGIPIPEKLTCRQQEVFDLLVAYINQHGYPPTISELSQQIGAASSNTAVAHLRALQKKGMIKITTGVSRGISIVGKKEPLLAVQLLREMIAEEPGARERVLEFESLRFRQI
ncbi:DNA-binding protein [Klebsiella aerogenes]|uniref:LexA family protein n=1 Tax=Klebsiella aerogenes TaxID=548 RepID=UPI0007BE94FE|nr:DNA-binding protein [Klebsiella aerogenes]KZQ72673.1 DNA-binding protein [Klebsiella aerogenes]HBZ4249957.1 DNA-binding protein [Klebsiella aerogenes]